MDVSSEMIHSLLPVFMVTTLGASMVAVGFIEGLAEAAAAVTKVFSGTLSDYLGRRKPVLLTGYALAALTKPVFALAPTLGWVLAARFFDRVGKGIRGAPRDALVADLTPQAMRGSAYGLRQALDSVGALLGPLLAIPLMIWLGGDIRSVIWVAVVPAGIAVALLASYVREPAGSVPDGQVRAPFTFVGAASLRRHYWLVVLLGTVFALARFSEAFLVLRAQDVGLGLAYAPLVMIVMNLLYATAAYPAGVAADRVGPRGLLLVGLTLLLVADLVLAVAKSPLVALAGAALWGTHMAFTQGLLSKLVADAAPAHLRGTAFGVFNLVGGVAVLLASLVAGTLWNAWGASATFLAGAVFASAAALVVPLAVPHTR